MQHYAEVVTEQAEKSCIVLSSSGHALQVPLYHPPCLLPEAKGLLQIGRSGAFHRQLFRSIIPGVPWALAGR